MTRNPNPNISAAIAARQMLSARKVRDVRESLAILVSEHKTGGPAITKSQVYQRADVSKAFIYSHPGLLREIDAAISEQGGILRTNARKQSTSSQQTLLKALTMQTEQLKLRNRQLQAENEKLKDEQGRLFGKIDRLISENERLKTSSTGTL